MSTSKIIKSIKTNNQDWTVIQQNDLCIAFVYGKDTNWRFTRVSLNVGGGYMLKNKAEGICMQWKEDDAIAKQLWSYFVSSLIK